MTSNFEGSKAASSDGSGKRKRAAQIPKNTAGRDPQDLVSTKLLAPLGKADPNREGRGEPDAPIPSTALVLAESPGATRATKGQRLSDIDEWGRSEKTRAMVRRLYNPIYEHWFRAEWENLDKIPKTGGALLVANHAGALPPDAPVIMHGIEKELERPVYGLGENFFKKVPFVSTAWARGGGVAAHPDNTYRLMKEQQQLVLVFPEGVKGPSKLYKDRYQLRRFGRGGFVEIAMRAGVPVVPIAVVGAEEAMPILARNELIAKALGLPFFPITANMLAFGPLLGGLAYFPAKFKLRVLDPVHFDVEADQERYSRRRIMDEAEQIRRSLQHEITDMLELRKSVWFG